MKILVSIWVAGIALGSLISSAEASLIASDSAADSAYQSGWSNGSNGGSGFGAWSLSVSINSGDRNGFFTGSSADNGTAPSGNIDTLGRSWGMYANGTDGINNALAAAYRPFSGALEVGQTLTLRLDNGFIENTGAPNMVGFTLLNADPATPIPAGVIPNSNTRFAFSFTGGDTTYRLSLGDGAGGLNTIDTGVGFTADGLSLSFTLLASDQYSFSINGNTPFVGSLGGSAGQAINGVALFNNRAGENGSNDAYFNSMEIVPEPATALLLVLGLTTLLAARRRK